MKELRRMCLLVGLLGIAAGVSFAQSSTYHLVVIDRADCPGEIVQVAETLAAFAHGKTGYYIVLGRGKVSIPLNATVLVNRASSSRSVIADYLETRAFRRYVSQPGILASLRFALKEPNK